MADLDAAARTLARLSRVLEHGCCDLSLAQYRVLGAVADGGRRASQVAGLLALARPTITAVVDGLEARGLVTRETVAADRRAYRLSITDDGREALAAADASLGASLAPLFARLERPGEVVGALAELGRALDELAAERMATRGRAPE